MGASDQSIQLNGDSDSLGQSHTVLERFYEIFSENTTAKLLRVAIEALEGNVSASDITVYTRFTYHVRNRTHPPGIRNMCLNMGLKLADISSAKLTFGLVGSSQGCYTCSVNVR